MAVPHRLLGHGAGFALPGGRHLSVRRGVFDERITMRVYLPTVPAAVTRTSTVVPARRRR
jgi:hypothetical protein